MLRDLVNNESRRLTNQEHPWQGNNAYSVISPDGRSVAYSWQENGVTDLRTIGTNGSDARVLGPRPDVRSVQPFGWSPDNAEVLARFVRDGGTVEIAMVSATDGAACVVKSFNWQGPGPGGMSLSPDGRFIGYDRREHATSRDIFLLATDGSRELVLVRHAADDHSPLWTPDGTGVLFLSDRTGATGVWYIPIEEGAPVGSPRVMLSNFGGWPLGFAPSGALYYGRQTGFEELYTATLDLESGRLIDPPTPVAERFAGSNVRPDWSPDGRYLSYFSWRDPRTIVIRELETGRERDLVPDLSYFRRPRWSSDSRSLWVKGTTKRGVEGRIQVDVDTGNVTQVVPRVPGVQRRAWSSDGKTAFNVDPQPAWPRTPVPSRPQACATPTARLPTCIAGFSTRWRR